MRRHYKEAQDLVDQLAAKGKHAANRFAKAKEWARRSRETVARFPSAILNGLDKSLLRVIAYQIRQPSSVRASTA